MEGGEEAMQVYEPLSAQEVESFAARLHLPPDTLRHIIIDPMDGVDDVDLRAELEQWVKDHHQEKERTRGMTLHELNADTATRFIPAIAAALRQVQDHLGALDKHKPKAAL
ncbi:hypothetical protein ACP70R_020275 [Stipagrostis hirtigluma subsp. patula]